jgi:hypothetical protein
MTASFSNPSSRVPIDPAILDLLACPACQGELRSEAQRAVCASCGRAYPVVDGIPVLIAGRAGQA